MGGFSLRAVNKKKVIRPHRSAPLASPLGMECDLLLQAPAPRPPYRDDGALEVAAVIDLCLFYVTETESS